MFLNVDGFWRCSNELFLAIFDDRLHPTKSSLTRISDNLLNSYFKFTLVLARSNRKFPPHDLSLAVIIRLSSSLF